MVISVEAEKLFKNGLSIHDKDFEQIRNRR